MVGTSATKDRSGPMSYLKAWGQIPSTTGTLNPSDDGSLAITLATSTNADGSVMCQSTTASTAPNRCLMLNKAVGDASIVNTKYVYLSISFWHTGTSAVAASAYVTAAPGLEIGFFASDWAPDSDYYAPATLGDPSALTDPAAAQALAASAAAALAVAAALY
jgi:hypothetical protein